LEQQITELKQQHEKEMAEWSKKYDAKVEKLLKSIENLQQSIPKIVADAVDTAIKATAATMKDLLKEVAHETATTVEKHFLSALEKKEKKENVVVVGLPERDEKADWDRIYDMARHAGIDQPDHAIKTTFRDGIAGKRRQNGAVIPRIMKVKFINKEYREKFLRTNYRGMGAEFEHLYVRHDMTYEEREKDRELKAELHQRRTAEANPNLVIRNGRIIDKSIRFSHAEN
jgi:hypothetical protein